MQNEAQPTVQCIKMDILLRSLTFLLKASFSYWFSGFRFLALPLCVTCRIVLPDSWLIVSTFSPVLVCVCVCAYVYSKLCVYLPPFGLVFVYKQVSKESFRAFKLQLLLLILVMTLVILQSGRFFILSWIIHCFSSFWSDFTVLW